MSVCQIVKFTFNINVINHVNHSQNIEIIFLNYFSQNGIKYSYICLNWDLNNSSQVHIIWTSPFLIFGPWNFQEIHFYLFISQYFQRREYGFLQFYFWHLDRRKYSPSFNTFCINSVNLEMTIVRFTRSTYYKVILTLFPHISIYPIYCFGLINTLIIDNLSTIQILYLHSWNNHIFNTSSGHIN